MSPADVRRLYALASSIDQKLALTDIDELALRLEAWSLVLEPVPLTYDQAKRAVAEHYRTNPDTTLMPGHIAAHAPKPPAPLHPPSQDPPCDVCGLQPANRRHQEHAYVSRDTVHQLQPGEQPTPVIPEQPRGQAAIGDGYRTPR